MKIFISLSFNPQESFNKLRSYITPDVDSLIQKEISWALNNVRIRTGEETRLSEPKAVWFLKLVRRHFLDSGIINSSDPTFPRIKEKVIKNSPSIDHYTLTKAKELLAHYMTMGIPQIYSYPLENQASAKVVFDALKELEKKYSYKSNRIVDEPSDGKLLFWTDKTHAWWDLEKPWCLVEKGAMKHCGNEPVGKEFGGTLLSYRELVNERLKKWKPLLSFHVDAKGNLRETKGYDEELKQGNAKPQVEYHDAIVQLLLKDLELKLVPNGLKKIIGGGHKPETNFHTSDLSEEHQDRIVKEKPGLDYSLYVQKLLERGEGNVLCGSKEKWFEVKLKDDYNDDIKKGDSFISLRKLKGGKWIKLMEGGLHNGYTTFDYNQKYLPQLHELYRVKKIRFQLLDLETVKDTKTGLVWKRNPEPEISHKDLIKKDFGEWRVPTIKELMILVRKDFSRNIDPIFNIKSSFFWSSSSYASDSSYAWLVSFGLGDVYGYTRGAAYAVRLVRGGQLDTREVSMEEVDKWKKELGL